MSLLNDLAKRVADEQKAIDSQAGDTRKRVLSMGKELRKMQKAQKKEQDDTGQTWKDWCEEQKGLRETFPAITQTKWYILVARYPAAYKEGMSIKEAYKEAGKWKQNGGSAPLPAKVTIKRVLARICAAASRVSRGMENAVEKDLAAIATEEDWKGEEIEGALEELVLLRQSCNGFIAQLRKVGETCDAST